MTPHPTSPAPSLTKGFLRRPQHNPIARRAARRTGRIGIRNNKSQPTIAHIAAIALLAPLFTVTDIPGVAEPVAYALDDSDCTPDVTVADGTLGNGTDGQPDQVGGVSSYVLASAVDSDDDDTKDECVLKFIKPNVVMEWDNPSFGENGVDYLVVAGGGGGGFGGGGGGGLAQGLRSEGSELKAANLGATTRIFVGAGGAGSDTATAPGSNGHDSYLISSNPDGSFDPLSTVDPETNGEVRDGSGVVVAVVMKGGGGGAKYSRGNNNGLEGGSSGGSNADGAVVPPSNTLYGNAGGKGYGGNVNKISAGGGGGAGTAGSNGNSDPDGGNGGQGLQLEITGENLFYAAGGGGGADSRDGGPLPTGGFGGNNVGGNATDDVGVTTARDGLSGRGAGGGGTVFTTADTPSAGFYGNYRGGSGGSGVVIVRFAPPPVDPVPVLGDVTRTVGGFEVPVSNVGVYSGAVTLAAVVSGESAGSSGSATVTDGVVSVSGLSAGESAVVTVTASASGFSPSSGSVTGVAKSSQASLSVSGSDVLRFGGSITVGVSGGSGSGDVTLGLTSASETAGCVLDGVVLSAGSVDAGSACVVEATRAGDANFLASAVASESFTVVKADRSVVFTSSVPADPKVGDTYEPSAEATGGLPVSFAVSGACSIDSGEVVFTSAATCTITASSDGDDTNYEAASDVTQSIVVGLANQTITFPAVGDKGFDDVPFQLSATSSRGLDVTYKTTDPESTDSAEFESDVCRVTSSGVVSIDAVGVCEVTASQAGVAGQVAAASDVTRSFRIQAVLPGAPRLTSVGFGDGELTVGFVAPDYVGGGTLSGYRAVATDGEGNQVVNNSCGTSSPCTITGLTNGSEYTVTVAAVNEAGVGPVSNTSPGVTPATKANPVTALSAIPGNGTLRVSWEKPSSFGGGNFTSYEVTLSSDGVPVAGNTEAEVTQVVDGGSNTFSPATAEDGQLSLDHPDKTSVVFSGLSNGTGYDVEVVTVTDANGDNLAADTVSTTGVPAVVPSVVRDASADLVGNAGAFVSWAVPVSNGGLPITAYAVTPESLSCEFDNAVDQFCEITGLARGVSVSISIAAVNGIGAGESVTVSVTTPALPSPGGGGDDGDDGASPVPPVSPTPAGSPVGGPGGPGGQPGGGPGGPGGPGVGPGGVPPVPGGVPGVPVPPERPSGTVGGVPVPTTTTASPGGRGVSVSAGGVTVGVDVPDPGDGAGGVVDRGGTPEPVVVPGQGKTISGGGVAAGSVVEVWVPTRSGSTRVAQIPVDADGEFAADVNVFDGVGEVLPIGRNVAQLVTTNGEGEQVVVDMPFTITQGEPVPEVLRETGNTPNAPVDGAVVTTAGEVDTDPQITSDESANTVVVDGTSWAVTVAVSDTAAVSGEGTTTQIVSTPGGGFTVAGSGFQPDTRVDVWVFSSPTLLGSATVTGEGTITLTVEFDQDLTVGEHTLQVQAVAGDGFIRATNLPVTLQPATQTTTSQGANVMLWASVSAGALILIALLTTIAIRRRQA